MNILVTGGAGYIGSHVVRELLQAKHQVVVVDSLVRGHREAVLPEAHFYPLDLNETAALSEVLTNHKIDCVVHFAALAYVGESVQQPMRYYRANVAGTISLLEAMQTAGVKRLVFSSSCATYGIPEQLPLVESAPQAPISPYGRSKLMCEHAIADYQRAVPDFGYIAFRYFNVAGCALDGSLGEDHMPETHLIPRLLKVAQGQDESFTLCGDDYPTPDGSCIRDFLHVEDIAAAHRLGLERLEDGMAEAFNLGTGHGFSVREVLTEVEEVTETQIPLVVGPRRIGDPPALYASAEKAHRLLGWQPQHPQLRTMIQSAWRWFQAHPNGYADSVNYAATS